VTEREYSAAVTVDIAEGLQRHLLHHIRQGQLQEDLCFALWRPSTGASRTTALIYQVIEPEDGERELHGGASFLPSYLQRVIGIAMQTGSGIAFLHCHFTPGWHDMSDPDIVAEQRLAPRVFAATGLPVVGLTMGTDGALSARFWIKTAPKRFERFWARNVRMVGDGFEVTFADFLAPVPRAMEELLRTYSAWGDAKQSLIARLHCGVVGAGSIGALVAEALARMGVQWITLIDHDRVERHNLDRLVHATGADIGARKVDVSARALKLHATADDFRVDPVPRKVTHETGYRAALDCDVLFSCVDRPWPRQVLNVIANSHLIPVVDGGIRIAVSPRTLLKSADWRAHVAMPGRPCLECLGQFDPAHVSVERAGLLDDPSYLEGLPREHFTRRNENVFAFAMSAAGLMVNQFLSFVVQPAGVVNSGGTIYHFVTASLDKEPRQSCKVDCAYRAEIATGDTFPYPVVEADPDAELIEPEEQPLNWWRKLTRFLGK
jgi:molybdopterin/thiamine biosynthesis adenylyltransferase